MQQGKAGTSAAAPSMKTIWQGTGPTDLETITEWVSSCCYLFPDYPPPHLLPPPSTPPPHPPTAAFFFPFFHFCENVCVCVCVFACSSTETPKSTQRWVRTCMHSCVLSQRQKHARAMRPISQVATGAPKTALFCKGESWEDMPMFCTSKTSK